VAARTTAGGGTRSGARTSTTRWASGRNTHSHSSSVPCRRLRERRSLPPCGILVVVSVPEGWSEVDSALTREFSFAGFGEAIAFVQRVASLAQSEDHHPDIDIRFKRVTLRWSTHSAGGVTERDRELAARSAELA
jgi:4a-hydroxytetrahydrobiopterin dehydratase